MLLERGQEGGGRSAKVGESAAQLVEVGAALGMLWTMSVEDGLQLRAPRQQRVAGDAAQIGLVDEQLVLGDRSLSMKVRQSTSEFSVAPAASIA